MKPRVTISLEHYNDLLDKSKIERVYNESTHVFSNPDALLREIQRERFHYKGKNTSIDRITFRVQSDYNTISVLEGKWWLKLDELLLWYKEFKNIDVGNIDSIRIAYICGMQSPYLLSSNLSYNKIPIAHTGDYYEAHCKIKYK